MSIETQLDRLIVTKKAQTITAPVLEWAEGLASAAYERERRYGQGFDTDCRCLCAIDRAVSPHTDDMPGTEGRFVNGLVLRSDGHRLHSATLDEAGITEGILLEAGDHYRFDPRDRHWTTVPSGSKAPQLIFSCYVMDEKGMTRSKIVDNVWWSLMPAMMEMSE